MKTIIIALFLSVQLFSQEYLFFFDEGITYNGTELITNSIDRTMELGSELAGSVTIANEGSFPFETLTSSGNSITSAINTTGQGRCYGNGITGNMTVGDKYKFTCTLTLNSGEQPIVKIRNQAFADITANSTLVNGANSHTMTIISANSTGSFFFFYNGAASNWSLANMKLKKMPYWTTTGNHTFDTSLVYKQSGTYSGKIIASGAGNGTTNTISLASTLFTSATSGTNYRFQVYAYTSTVNTTLTFKLGDILLTKDVPTSGMNVLNFDFKATASTTGNIYLYTNQAATVYLDEASFKSGQ